MTHNALVPAGTVHRLHNDGRNQGPELYLSTVRAQIRRTEVCVQGFALVVRANQSGGTGG